MLFGICPRTSRTAKFWQTYVVTYKNFMVIVEPCLTALKGYLERNITVYRVPTWNSTSGGTLPRILFQVVLATGILLEVVHLARMFQIQNNPNKSCVIYDTHYSAIFIPLMYDL